MTAAIEIEMLTAYLKTCRARVKAYEDEMATKARRIKQLEEALLEALDYMYNPFEPNNQLPQYYRLKRVLKNEAGQ